MKDIIEKLKQNEKPFGLLSKEEQELLKKVEFENRLFYSPEKGWVNDRDSYTGNAQTFRIKPDYQPEPEYVDYEISLDSTCELLGINWSVSEFFPLGEIVSMPDFEGFYIKSDYSEPEEWVECLQCLISRNIRAKKEIIARFVK